MRFLDAARLAELWVEIACKGEARIVRENTIAKPYGWIFFYQSNEYGDGNVPGSQLAGNAPILIDRVNGNLIVFGTARSIEHYIAEYETTIPTARLAIPIEPARWQD